MFDIETAVFAGAGRVQPDPNWTCSLHMHTEWEFVYFLSGTGRINLPEETMRPRGGFLVVYPPGLAHEEASDPLNPEETIFITISVNGDAPVGAHLLIPDTTGDIRWLIEHLYAEGANIGVGSLANTYAKAFLQLVERAWSSGVSVEHDSIDRALQYMASHFRELINLDNLADAACLSRTHFSHKFSQRIGVSPLKYLQQFRLEEAKRLLVTTELPIFEVANSVGIKDPLYFSRAFKSSTGVSPKEYRAKSKTAK